MSNSKQKILSELKSKITQFKSKLKSHKSKDEQNEEKPEEELVLKLPINKISKDINNNNNSLENANLEKSKLMKSINNKNNNNNNKFIHSSYNKMIYDPKNEINFHTGFVRSQKNIYDDVYSRYFKNNKKNEIRIKNYRRKKEEANKLSLPEIEEYKSIIKEIENRKKYN